MREPRELQALVADVTRVWHESQTPDALRASFQAWATENSGHVDRLRAVMGATVAWWIVKGREAGHDPDVLDQVALQSTQFAIAWIARAMKIRQGQLFEPARVAIVAYAISKSIADLPAGDVNPNLEGLTDCAEAIQADVSAENERLRAIISEIADMDLGDPELEHREIVARCRTEVASWERDAAWSEMPEARS